MKGAIYIVVNLLVGRGGVGVKIKVFFEIEGVE